MTVYGNYDVIAFKSCIQIFTVYLITILKVLVLRTNAAPLDTGSESTELGFG